MEPKIAAGARPLDPVTPTVTTSTPPARAEKPPVVTGPDPADLRLVIEEDQASGSYIYKTINRATGEVVQQFPRDDLLKLHAERQYQAGSVIRTEA